MPPSVRALEIFLFLLEGQFGEYLDAQELLGRGVGLSRYVEAARGWCGATGTSQFPF